ncbi:MAG: carboxypeptidase-like regulatory domain-containing protein [Duncaniella sp.]|nr:carboxypeptidase-like regulatory domain-containing protein [Duncaniella sp.]
MKKFFYLLYLIAGIAAIVACSSDLSEELEYGSIAGSVSDSNTGEPVATVNVSLSPGGISTVTGSDGTFHFQKLSPGNYTLTIKKVGYQDNSASVNVKSGDPTAAHLLIGRIPAYVTADRDLLDFGDNQSLNTLSFNIVNTTYEDLEWEIEERCNWISEIKPDHGILKYGKTEAIVVVIDRELLSAGINEAVIVVRSSNGSSEVKVIAVGPDKSLPVLNTLETTDITSTSGVLNGEILHVGSPAYTERGFVYSLNTMPTFDNMLAKLTVPVNEEANYSYTLKGLTLGEKYYVRAYAVNSIGTAYSTNEITFTTVKSTPQITIQEATNVNITNGTVTLNGMVENAGDPAYFERGFVYSTSSNPTVENTKIKANGTGIGTFSSNISGLQLDQRYYARAYTIAKINDSESVVYSKDEISFILTPVLPNISMQLISNKNTSTGSVTFNGKVTNAGEPAYFERGFVFSTMSNPTVNNTKIKANGTGVGAFSADASGLDLNKQYYVKAYAIVNINNTESIVYSNEEVSFSLSTIAPSVSLQPVSNINLRNASATFNGTVVNVGDPIYTEKGFVYGSSPTPTINDIIVVADGTKDGVYSVTVDNLELDKLYYVRAYIKSGASVYYSKETMNFSLTTNSPVSQMISVTEISYSGKNAKFMGIISDSGEPSYTKRGFVYGFNSNPIAENDQIIVISGSGNNEFSIKVSDLVPEQKYFVRVFVEQNGKYFYSNNELEFSLQLKPAIIGATTVSEVLNNSATFTSSIEFVGDPAYTERGFVYGKSPKPTISDNVVVAGGIGEIGNFSKYVAGLPESNIYVRAYAKTLNVIAYGEDTLVPYEWIEIPSAGIAVQKHDLGTGSWSTAKTMCDNSTLGGFTDWRLPTKDELMVIYLNREKIGGFKTADQANSEGVYWSGTVSGGGYIYYVDFFNGYCDYTNATGMVYNIRAVRTLDK